MRRFRALPLLLLLLFTAWGAADSWTVQTVALRDYREARARVQQLLDAGFDAYTEFSMSDGVQYARVRVGCHAGRPLAEALAQALRDHYTEEAVAVPRNEDAAGGRACVERRMGFRAESWTQRAPEVAAFEVDVGGVRALLRYRDGAWRLLQEGALDALEDVPPAGASATAQHQVTDTGTPWVMGAVAGHELRLCPGRLLAAEDDAVIVAHEGAVYACEVTPRSEAP